MFGKITVKFYFIKYFVTTKLLFEPHSVT